MQENENLKEAVEKLDRISEDERMQRIIDLREKAIMDEKAIYRKGIKDGREEGRIAGKIEGEKNEKIQIAKNMLQEKMSIEVITKVTGLTKEEIEKLKNY